MSEKTPVKGSRLVFQGVEMEPMSVPNPNAKVAGMEARMPFNDDTTMAQIVALIDLVRMHGGKAEQITFHPDDFGPPVAQIHGLPVVADPKCPRGTVIVSDLNPNLGDDT